MKDSVPKKKQTICNSSNDDRYENHRSNFRSCPCCPHDMESGEWDKAATTLILNPRSYKAGSVAILSECPKCFEESWVHHPMDSFDWGEYPKVWKECVKKLEKKEVKLQAVREWGGMPLSQMRKS